MIRTLQIHGYKINRFPDRGPLKIKSVGANDVYANPELDEAINQLLADQKIKSKKVINIVPINPQPGYGEDRGSLNLMIFYRV